LKIKESFQEEDKKLEDMDRDVKKLAQRLEEVSEEAERASKEEVDGG
jgi:prefoldin subunit 5